MGRPLLYRRGPSSGPGYVSTTDLRFRRVERLRLDVPSTAALDTMSGALLDRTGKPLLLPVALGERLDGVVRYVSGEIALAPLAPGDYLVEITSRASPAPVSAFVAFRIVP